MSSKADKLENQQDRITELNRFKKSKSDYKTDSQNKSVEFADIFTMDVVMNEDNKARHEINIEIDIFQRTTVFSSDFTMWI